MSLPTVSQAEKEPFKFAAVIRQLVDWVNGNGVVGPASATDNAAARFDSTTGKLLQDSPLIVADTTGALSRSGNGGIPLQGTNTNDSASSGQVGEYVTTSNGDHNANATVTMTIAVPCVVTWTGHGFPVGAVTPAVKFSTSGALPTGITAGTTYYLKAIDANTFNIATSVANALAGTFINTSGSQSGTHTGDIRVFMTTGTTQDLAAISLGAGDWEVSGQVLTFGSGTTNVTYLSGSISTTSNTYSRTFGRAQSLQYGGLVLGNAEFTVFSFAAVRFSLAATTTIFINGNNSFTVSTSQSSGWLRARRVR